MAGGAAAAAAAAAAAKRRLEQEEEEMTTYESDDLAQEWEFKIIRANRPLFGNRHRLQQLLEQEAVAGWTMIEKFDNSRIRFKRPLRARLNDSMLPPGVDPYRVHYGLHPGAFAAVLALTLLAVVGGIMFWIAVAFR
jgi:hypothetical protein